MESEGKEKRGGKEKGKILKKKGVKE